MLGLCHRGALRGQMPGIPARHQWDTTTGPCSLAGLLFAFTGITPDQFKEIVATGATDEELGAWINVHSKVQDRQAVIEWNNKMRDLRLSEIAPAVQAYMEDYIPKYVPTHRPCIPTSMYFYDLEESVCDLQRLVLDVKEVPVPDVTWTEIGQVDELEATAAAANHLRDDHARLELSRRRVWPSRDL